MLAIASTSVYAVVMTAAAPQPRVLCVGETLFDGLPNGIFLGGAPLNVACHLASLGASVQYASAVGNDRLGIDAVRRLNNRGVDTTLVSTTDAAETGFVTAEIDASGDASYEFVTPAAWDYLEPSAELEAAASTADAVVYGTLASRDASTRDAVRAAAAAAKQRVVDINLRPPFIDDAIVAMTAQTADVLKLNDDELAPVAAALTRAAPSDAASAAAVAADAASAAPDDAAAVADAAAALGEATGATTVIVTRGENGAVVSSGGSAWACGGFVAPAKADTVGAGDSFLAAFLVELLRGAAPDAALEAACRLGAFVAGRPGATPEHEVATIASLSPCAWGVDECVLEL